jgi:hypothetical protein
MLEKKERQEVEGCDRKREDLVKRKRKKGNLRSGNGRQE